MDQYNQTIINMKVRKKKESIQHLCNSKQILKKKAKLLNPWQKKKGETFWDAEKMTMFQNK